MVFSFFRLGVRAAGGPGHSLAVQLRKEPGGLLRDLKVLGEWGTAQGAAF
jgi:hypothetical protein